MRKLVILSVTGVLIAGGAGASAYYYVHNRANYYDQAIQSLRAGDVKRAQIQLRNAVRQNPSNASAHFQLAQVELGLGDAVAAEKDYRAALALGFDADAITPALAQTYLMQQRFRDLLADFPAVESPPELAARIDVLRALAYVRLNDPDNAAAAIDEAEKLAPTLTDVPLNAARIALSRQDRVTAERELNRTLKLDPRNAAALTLKAEMQRTRGDRDGAMKTIGLAVADTPEGIRARLTRAGFYIDDSQDADAKKDVDAVLEVEPQNLMATYLRGVLLTRAKDWPAADAVLTKVSQYASQLPKAYFFIAVVKSNTGQLEQAHDAASRYVARVPQDPEGVKLLARVAVDSKQPTDAIRVLNDAVTAGRADLEMLDLLGRAYTMAGRPTDAVATFEKAASLAPGNSDILARLASARADAAAVGSDGSDGVQKTSLQATPAPPAPTETSIVTALAIGDLGRASSEIDALRAKDGNTELVADLSARLKMAQLDLPGARSQLDTALKQFPDSVRLRLALARLAEIQLQPDQTERWLTEIVQRQPTSEPALAGLIGIMINSGRVNRAIALADAARKAAPAEATFPAMIADLQ
ncbi:MAG TPA: tetratricopeptide repeat protein, partial [Acetobacteraceae bacterium]|nr:tetratricopeptide repeat protein [Acetobacteraceae bacterium]